MSDAHLEELARQCMNVTPLGRLAGHEAVTVLTWLMDNGHMTRTGQPLEKPLPAPRPIAHNPDGSPVYAANADFSTHNTVTMDGR